VLVLFYAMAALEIDPGEVGDDFGDVYDTHLPAHAGQVLKADCPACSPALFLAPLTFRPSRSFVFWTIPELEQTIRLAGRSKRIYLHCAVWRL
jgi:hypothetical protein